MTAERTDLSALEGYLGLLKISPRDRADLLEPYVHGFHKKCDGKSTPLWFMRLPSFMRAMGFDRDIASVAHDFDYYRGMPRWKADGFYQSRQSMLGVSRLPTWMEATALKMFGWIAWRRHEKKRRAIPGYGTYEYIEFMQEIRP